MLLCDITQKKGKKMRCREILRMIGFDFEKYNKLDDALRSLIVFHRIPVFEDKEMQLVFDNLLRDLRDELMNSWNRYITSKKCNGKDR